MDIILYTKFIWTKHLAYTLEMGGGCIPRSLPTKTLAVDTKHSSQDNLIRPVLI